MTEVRFPFASCVYFVVVQMTGYAKTSDMPDPDAVAAAERVIEDEETIVATVAPEEMPVPLTPMPTTSPVVLARLEIVLEPLVVLPVMLMVAGYVKASEMPVPGAVAATERVIEDDETMLATVAPEGMPVPITPMPTASPAVVARPEIMLEPVVVVPVNEMPPVLSCAT